MINAQDCTVRTPIDTDMPEHPSRTLCAPIASDERPSNYSPQIVKYHLAQLIDRLMSLGALKPDHMDYGTIQSAHAEVGQLLSKLPLSMSLDKPDTAWDLQHPEIIKHRLTMAIITSSFLLALHKPHAVQHPQASSWRCLRRYKSLMRRSCCSKRPSNINIRYIPWSSTLSMRACSCQL